MHAQACEEIKEQKLHLQLKPGINEVGNYNFPHPCDGSWNSHLFFKRPLVDTDFDMPAIRTEQCPTPLQCKHKQNTTYGT